MYRAGEGQGRFAAQKFDVSACGRSLSRRGERPLAPSRHEPFASEAADELDWRAATALLTETLDIVDMMGV
jgi:hypothetical protein